jgi:hypothetical protein
MAKTHHRFLRIGNGGVLLLNMAKVSMNGLHKKASDNIDISNETGIPVLCITESIFNNLLTSTKKIALYIVCKISIIIDIFLSEK